MGHPVAGIALLLVLLCSGALPEAQVRSPTAPPPKAPAPIENDLDAFMAKVLERRAETWRRLHDYILDEREKFEVRGPGDMLMFGQQRSYSWYVRDGYLIRSPVKFNGVALADAERRKYEQDWLTEEKAREQSQNQRRLQRAKQKQAARSGGAAAGPFDTGAPVQAGIDDILRDGVEPRFISEAYFLQFKFEPGNYYLAGRERLDDQDVVKIEYYPRKRMFEDLDKDDDDAGRSSGPPKEEPQEKPDEPRSEKEKDKEKQKRTRGEQDGKKSDREKQLQEDFERKFNKVSLVTLWIDPVEHQIVKYSFDLPDFGFLPGRWAVRLDDAQASMTMGRPVEGVWLPKEVSVQGGFTLANGGYRVRYGRAFFDYKLGDVRAKIRGYDMREP